MAKDPVFQALHDYKSQLTYDVIRYEYVLLAEIARCKQYAGKSNKTTPLIVIEELEKTLKYIRSLRPAYLSLKFSEYLRTVPFWKRRALRADPGGWKYVFYCRERVAALEEITKLVTESLTPVEKTAYKEGN